MPHKNSAVFKSGCLALALLYFQSIHGVFAAASNLVCVPKGVQCRAYNLTKVSCKTSPLGGQICAKNDYNLKCDFEGDACSEKCKYMTGGPCKEWADEWSRCSCVYTPDPFGTAPSSGGCSRTVPSECDPANNCTNASDPNDRDCYGARLPFDEAPYCTIAGHKDRLCVLQNDPTYVSNKPLQIENGVVVAPYDGAVIQSTANIKAIEFRWAPSRDLTLKTVWPKEFQRIVFDGEPYKAENWINQGVAFTLPGPQANSFKVDFATLACGRHTWRIDTGSTDFVCLSTATTNNCHPVVEIKRPGITWNFTKECCEGAPDVAITSPDTGMVYPADTSAVSLNWKINTNTCPTTGEYNRVSVTYLNDNTTETFPKVDGSGNPIVTPSTDYNHQYVPAGGGSCSTVERNYSWFAEAKNAGDPVISYDRDPASPGSRTFKIVGNVIDIVSTSLTACYSSDSGANVAFDVVIDDKNQMTDRLKFEFYTQDSGNNYTVLKKSLESDQNDTDISDGLSCSTTGEVVTCAVNMAGSSLGRGNYLLKVKTANGCTSGGFSDLVKSDGSAFEALFSVDTAAAGGTLTLDQEYSSDFVLTLKIEGLSAPAGFQFQTGLYETANNGSGNEIGCAHDEYENIGSAVTCPGSGTDCKSAPFGVADLNGPGKYCFRAITTSSLGCFTEIRRLDPYEIYLVKVHMLRDTSDTLDCEAGSPPTSGAEKLPNVPVTLDVTPTNGQPDGFGRNTGSDGIAEFGANLTGLSEVGVFTTCTGCVQAAECRDPFIDCGGPNKDGEYAKVEESVDNIRLPLNIELSRGPDAYEAYIRIGTIPRITEWMTSINGDVFAPGMQIGMCTTKSQGISAGFDGALIERPEGTPYTAKGTVAGRPFMGGYLFTHAVFDPNDIEKTNFITEPLPTKRYALALAKDPLTDLDVSEDRLFGDYRFDSLAGTEMQIPKEAHNLPNLNAKLQDRVYETDDLNTKIQAVNGYKLKDGPAVIYYSNNNSDEQHDLRFDNPSGFKNLDNIGKLIIITDRDVHIGSSVGYGCWDTGIEGKCGAQAINAEYSPKEILSPPNIEVSIISYGDIIFDPFNTTGTFQDALNAGTLKTIKLKGTLAALGSVNFERRLKDLSSKYPGEAVQYDSDVLYQLTTLERTLDKPVTGLTSSLVQLDYGY